MNQLILVIAPYVAWVFSILLILHIVKNIRLQRYASGSVVGYVINCGANAILGYYMLSIHEYIIGAHQLTAALLSLFIITQSFFLKHATN